MGDCVFCDIIDGNAPATKVMLWDETIAIVPLNPVVPGHVLIIPVKHVSDIADDSHVTALTAYRAAQYVKRSGVGDCNIITSRGAEATQTVFHLHIHIIPRKEGDGLKLPWSK